MSDGASRVTPGRLGPSGRAALQLLACCPRIPTDVVAVLMGMHHTTSAAQLLLRLQTADLVHAEAVKPGPLLGIRSVRLWSLSAVGRTVVQARGIGPMPKDQARLPYGGPDRPRDPRRQPDVPLLIAAYRLLGVVVSGLNQRVRVVAWEHPWVRSFRPAGQTRVRHARLPAAAVLAPYGESGTAHRCVQVLLLPDLGTAPVARHRPLMRTLLELRQEWWAADNRDEPLLVVATVDQAGTETRAAAWRSLLQHVVPGSGEPPLRARLLGATDAGLAFNPHDPKRRWAAGVDQVLSLVARHPLLTQQQLAFLVGTTRPRIVRLQAELLGRGWIRPIRHEQLIHALQGRTADSIQRLGLVELTPAGRREAARRLLLPGAVAARHHGLVGGRVAIRRFLRHLAHTVGANAFFVALVQAARNVCSRGGDDALEEWRSAAACARGRFRPDGYGSYRRAGSRFGFFLEYDRGTERPGDYAAKLAAYYRYRDSGSAARDYDGFPTLLLVSISDTAEARFTHQVYLSHQQHGSAALSVLLTTSSRIEAHPEAYWDPSGAHRQVSAPDSIRCAATGSPGGAARDSSLDGEISTSAYYGAWCLTGWGARWSATWSTSGKRSERSSRIPPPSRTGVGVVAYRSHRSYLGESVHRRWA